MSKVSKGRDRWRQLGQARYNDVCPGCGFYLAANGTHRSDCTKVYPSRFARGEQRADYEGVALPRDTMSSESGPAGR